MENVISILAVLACPVGMGLMGWLMLRAPQSSATPARTEPVGARATKLCLNPRVVTLLVVSGIAIWLLAPQLLGVALPLLLLAACPLSMLLMLRSMHGGQCAPQHQSLDRAPEPGASSGAGLAGEVKRESEQKAG